MFNTRILSLGILSDEDSVDVIVRGLESWDGDTRSNVGEKVECTTQSQIKRNMALSD